MSTVDNTDMATICRAHFEFLDYITEIIISFDSPPLESPG